MSYLQRELKKTSSPQIRESQSSPFLLAIKRRLKHFSDPGWLEEDEIPTLAFLFGYFSIKGLLMVAFVGTRKRKTFSFSSAWKSHDGDRVHSIHCFFFLLLLLLEDYEVSLLWHSLAEKNRFSRPPSKGQLQFYSLLLASSSSSSDNI